MKGLVLKSTGKWYIVELEDGSVVSCSIRGKLRLEGLSTTNPIAVGDIVILGDTQDNEGKLTISDLEISSFRNLSHNRIKFSRVMVIFLGFWGCKFGKVSF